MLLKAGVQVGRLYCESLDNNYGEDRLDKSHEGVAARILLQVRPLVSSTFKTLWIVSDNDGIIRSLHFGDFNDGKGKGHSQKPQKQSVQRNPSL